ncbi:uncharacterized protein LOC125679942 isoform X2 [Ostrea edulis]|uniref:uncharacterized protein LOC125679942 isoform X2 n=1 Tax=Ostrea edulis TaxID=37623 RepID=UPI0024AFBF78|nr:uncharacterized protein LOC125679942 isoform X2 [Ostrea edulis]
MPPVRTRVTRLSEVERNRQFVSPARGRGRRRRPNSVATDSSRPIPTASAVVNAAGGTTQSETDDTHAIQDLQANPSGEFDVNHQCLIPPIDIFPPAVDFAGPNFSVTEYQPSVINSYFDPVSFHVPEKLKNQIWEGKFIDISLLLRSARELDGHLETQGQIEIRNGAMCLVKPKHNSFLSIEKWSSAFIIFTSIMLETHHKIRINSSIKEDLRVWEQFLANFNGISVISSPTLTSDSYLQLYTDSAGGTKGGFGIYFAGSWAHASWPHSWSLSDIVRDMTFLELFPVYVAIVLWSPQLANKRILFHIDNSAVVQVINSATSKSHRVMKIVQKLVLITLQHNITIQAQYIPSKRNVIADSISRSQWRRFRHLAPHADQWPTQLPNQIWDI